MNFFHKLGLIINNIGTPKGHEVPFVKEYLEEFLMDEDVVGLPYLLRYLLVKKIIVPRRSPHSAEKYKKIWIPNGSPLMVYTQNFASKLQKALGDQVEVVVGMRYGNTSLTDALQKLHSMGIHRAIIAPMYPQYAQATTGSVQKYALGLNEKKFPQFDFQFLPYFFSEKFFIQNFARIIRQSIKEKSFDHFLFSFHGLPKNQITKNSSCQLTETCCLSNDPLRKQCYRSQSLKTAFLLAQELGLRREQWSYSFQSRLGPTEWTRPYTDHVLKQLGQSGVNKLAVISPAFVADCLETLEELGIEGKQTFLENGGKEYLLIPCLNDDSQWVSEFADHIRSLYLESSTSHQSTEKIL